MSQRRPLGRDFRALLGAQFLGAFNDNLFKQLVLLLAVGTLFPGRDMQGLAFAIFSLPFVVLSGIAGDLSERFSKQRIIVQMKVLEIAVMALGVWSLMSLNWSFLLFVLFFMGAQSAIFGPPKYGVIPEIVHPEGLVRANGNIAMTTFLAALGGQALAGPLMDAFGPAAPTPRLWMPGIVSIGLAVVGTLFALRMRPLPATRPDLKLSKNPLGQLPQTIRSLRQWRPPALPSGAKAAGLMGLIVLYSAFWFNSGLIGQAINGLAMPDYLDIPEGRKVEVSLLLSLISVGIIVGSALAPKVAARLSLKRAVWLGGLLMTGLQVFLLLVGPVFHRENGGLYWSAALLLMMGVGGAIFVVPIQSYLQAAPPEGMRGQTFAVANFMNFLCMFLAGVAYMLCVPWLGPTGTQLLGGVAMGGALWWSRHEIAAMRIGTEPTQAP